MKNKFLIIFLVLVLLLSCNKDVTDVNPEYIGDWIGPDAEKTYYLNIDESSNTQFIIRNEQGENEVKNGILRIKDNELIMKNVFVFEIIEQPYQLDSMITFMLHDYEYPVTWQMKLKAPKSWGGGVVYYYK